MLPTRQTVSMLEAVRAELESDLGDLVEFDPTPTRKLPPGFKPKAKNKKPEYHPMHNKVGPSTTAPTRKVQR